MEYDILTAGSSYDLRAKVKLAIGEGWQLLGGVAMNNERYAQAMIRPVPSFALSTTTMGDVGSQISLVEINERMLAR